MNLKLVLGGILVAILFFFGIIFAFASSYENTRLVVSGLFFVVGFAILYYITRKPNVNIQKLELSGQMKAVSLKCPNCSASIKSDRIKIDRCNSSLEDYYDSLASE